MKSKHLILAFVFSVSILASVTAGAQTQTPPPASGEVVTPPAPLLTPEQRVERRLAHAKRKLKLTDDQVAQMRSILMSNESKLQSDRQSLRMLPPGTDPKDARQQLRTDRVALLKQLKGVLTPEQIDKFKKMRLETIDRQEEKLERQKRALQK